MDAGKAFFGIPVKDWRHGYWRQQQCETAGEALSNHYRTPVEIHLTAEQQDQTALVCRTWDRAHDKGVIAHLLKGMAQASLAIWDEYYETWLQENVAGEYSDNVGLLTCHPLWVNKQDSVETDLVLDSDAEDFTPHVLVWVDFTTLKQCRASIRGWAFGFEVKKERNALRDGRFRLRDEDLNDLPGLRNWEADHLKHSGSRRQFVSPLARKMRT